MQRSGHVIASGSAVHRRSSHALDGLSQLSDEDPIAALAEYRIMHGKIARREAAVIAATRKAGHDDAAVRIALGREDEEKYPDDVALWLTSSQGILVNAD